MFSSVLDLPIFKDIDIRDESFVLSRFTERNYASKQVVFFQGDEGHEMYIIKSGALKIYQEHEYKQIILAHQFPGETLGELEVLHHDNRRLASAATIEKTTLWMIKSLSSRRSSMLFRKIMRRLFYVISERLRQANRKIEYLAFLDARVRVANLLLDLYTNFGVETEEGYMINWKITQQHFADMIGIGRESATRALHEFQDGGLIRMQNKHFIIIDLHGLKSLTGPDRDTSEWRQWHSCHNYNRYNN